MTEERICVFCDIVAGHAPANIVKEWSNAIAFTPFNPVNPTHTLIVPRVHVDNATENPFVLAKTMLYASLFAQQFSSSNIITSTGKPATQSIFHLHIHVIGRFENDQLMVPWGTTGNPHDAHWCKIAAGLQADIESLEEELQHYRWSGRFD